MLQRVVSVSGGKDSTATYLRCLERGKPFRAVFADVGNEAEETYDYKRHGIRLKVEWSKTSRGGKQYEMLFDAQQDARFNASEACSTYGLCE